MMRPRTFASTIRMDRNEGVVSGALLTAPSRGEHQTTDIREALTDAMSCRRAAGPRGGHDEDLLERQRPDRRTVRQGHRVPLSDVTSWWLSIRPTSRTDHAGFMRGWKLAGLDLRRWTPRTPAFEPAKHFKISPRRNWQLPHLRRPRRADGGLRLDDACRRTARSRSAKKCPRVTGPTCNSG